MTPSEIPASPPFRFKQFEIHQDRCAMKVGTDGVLLGAWPAIDGISRVLDIGTGSGVIALMLAQRASKALIHGVEIDGDAKEQADENARRSPWTERIQIHGGAIQDFTIGEGEVFDLIVSNPPFFSGGTLSENHSRNAVRHTVKLPSGELLRSVRRLLSTQGKFCVILPYIEGLRFVELASSYNLYCTRMTEVLPKPGKPIARLLLQFENDAMPLMKDRLTIQGHDPDSWTDEYRMLTGAFYLHM